MSRPPNRMAEDIAGAPMPRSRVRLAGGVREGLEYEYPADADLGREDSLMEVGRREAAGEALTQAAEGNTGSVDGSMEGVVETALDEDVDAPEAQRMDDDTLINVIELELSSSLGADSDEIQGARAKCLDYYFGRPRGDEKRGRSQVQSLDIADMTESALAQIIPAFTDDLSVAFKATGSDPVSQKRAREESKAVDHVVQQENSGFLTLYETIKDGLLLMNCVCKVYLDESTQVHIEKHENVNPFTMALLMRPQSPREQVVVDSTETTTNEDGTERTDVVIKRLIKQKRIIVKAVPPDEIRVNSDHDSVRLENARFVSHERIMRKSELVAMGVPRETADNLPQYGSRTDTTQNARAQTAKEWEVDQSDKTDYNVLVHENWMLVDYDGDGLAERRRVMMAEDQTILFNDPMNYMGIVSGAPYINPHKWLGIGYWQKLQQTQDFKTHLLRQASDNTTNANQARLGYVTGQVNPDDLFNAVPGGGVAMKRPDAIVPIPTPNVLPAIFQMLGYGDKMRTERAGASLDMQSQQVPMQNRTAHGAERVISSMEEIIALVARTMAETVLRDIYLAVHYLLRTHFREGLQQEREDGPAVVQPGAWPPRNRITLKPGLTIGQRLKMMGALDRVFMQQTEMVKAGKEGELVTNATIHQTLVDYARMAGLPQPEQYWVDPQSPQAIKAMEAKQKNAEEQAAKMEAAQQKVIDLQEMVIREQERTKRMQALLKQQEADADRREDRRQHGEDVANDLTEMELKYNKDVPGSAV